MKYQILHPPIMINKGTPETPNMQPHDGDEIELSEAEAKPLLAIGVIAPVSSKSAPKSAKPDV